MSVDRMARLALASVLVSLMLVTACKRTQKKVDDEVTVEVPAVGAASTGPKLADAVCDDTVTDGCSTLAERALTGVGAKRDLAAARTLYGKACTGGDHRACVSLGELHQNGIGGTSDRARARELYQQACDAAEGTGCQRLGLVYMAGIGVPIDQARADAELASAVKHFDAACQAGSADACANLGLHRQKGMGTAANAAEA
ncbi:MAG TPA: tetratricopeptide repeat protein, partial [Kofleriaceae bacterium]|nr:tetratricopeptide repeat protein [Kofleriaceae bacterium]